MPNNFKNTLLTNSDLGFLFGCAPVQPIRWRKYNYIKSLPSPNKKNAFVCDFEDLQNIRKNAFKDSLDFKKKVIMFYNIKGGCSKSTTSSQFAFLLSLMGYRVLAIDIDHNQDLSILLGHDPEEQSYSFYNVLFDDISIDEAKVKITDNLDLVPANEDFDDMEVQLSSTIGKEQRFKEVMDSCKDDYDIIIIDSHPEKNMLNTSMIHAADLIITPTTCDYLGYRGAVRTFNHVSDLLDDAFPGSTIQDVIKIIPNRYSNIKKLDKSYYDEIVSDYKGMVTKMVKESSIFGKANDLMISIFNIKQATKKINTFEELNQYKASNGFVGLNIKDSICLDFKDVVDEILQFLRT